MPKLIRIISPFFLIIIFILFISFYYKNNSENFFFLKNINQQFILTLVLLGFLYLLLETLILNIIVKFNNRRESF